MKHLFISMFLLFFGFVGYMYYYLGIWKNVSIETAELPAMKMIAKAHTGPYFKIVPTIESVETWAKNKNLDCTLSFGEYFDNPEKVEESRLKSRGGCVVSEFPVEEVPSEFEKVEIPARKYVTALFEGAPSVGPYKVYKKVEAFMKENRLESSGPVIEIYEVKSQKAVTTKYLFPIQ